MQEQANTKPQTEIQEQEGINQEQEAPNQEQKAPNPVQESTKPATKPPQTWVKRAMTTSLSPEYIGKINTLLPSLNPDTENINKLVKELVDYYIQSKTEAGKLEKQNDALEIELIECEQSISQLRNTIQALETELKKAQQAAIPTPAIGTKPSKPTQETENDFMSLLGF
ncbi:MAG: hypothetical protein R2831_10920 [Chitinophagaceae bacterium]